MKDGVQAILVPGSSNLVMKGSSSMRNRIKDVLKAMTEEVTVIDYYNCTGSAKVRDKRGKVFYCNRDDLSDPASKLQ